MEPLFGTYIFQGRTLVITDQGMNGETGNPLANFNWGGPITRGIIGKADGQLVFFDGQENHSLKVEFDAEGQPVRCLLFDMTLQRQ